MKTLRIYTLFFALISLAFSAQAQGRRGGQRGEKIDAARTAFLTDKMKLTPEQAQKFWPLYNEFDAKRKELRQKGRPFKGQNLETLSDAQIKDQMTLMFDNRQKELNLDKEYADKFQKVISVRQLAAMYKGEREFTKALLQKLNESKVGPAED
ncbi:condensation domain-containing protein [Adhaeribacter soli]|uniref:Sensor of ECF-type sigma factor n=1 Tax=Adhaeribacter soli TaxID=2607655 RepID=A0A5N1IRJ1_9BACT|nr:hypothetical protein [Adhaeribacter soli]KAA9332714.1 hypothetical protein F0P94_11950 [Adhaeribacter soli]